MLDVLGEPLDAGVESGSLVEAACRRSMMSFSD
jgi:hypothetical protein